MNSLSDIKRAIAIENTPLFKQYLEGATFDEISAQASKDHDWVRYVLEETLEAVSDGLTQEDLKLLPKAYKDLVTESRWKHDWYILSVEDLQPRSIRKEKLFWLQLLEQYPTPKVRAPYVLLDRPTLPLRTPVAELELCVGLINRLINAGHITVKDILTAKGLTHIPGVRDAGLKDIGLLLAPHGYKLNV